MLDANVQHDMEQMFALHTEVHAYIFAHYQQLQEMGWPEPRAWSLVEGMTQRIFGSPESVYIEIDGEE